MADPVVLHRLLLPNGNALHHPLGINTPDLVRLPMFERYTADGIGLLVSICLRCWRFVAAAPDPCYLDIAEAAHVCPQVKKKPAARAK